MPLAAGVTGAAIAVLCVAVSGIGQQGTASGLRATAVLALPFLVGAYVAPALAVLWPGRLSYWLLARRRTFGLAFSAVFAVHLVLIARFLSLPPDPPPRQLGLILGFVAYTLLLGMTLTSIGRIAGTTGAARVRLLRQVGEQWVFAVFTLTLINGALRHSGFWLVPLTIVIAAYAMRFRAWRLASRPKLA